MQLHTPHHLRPFANAQPRTPKIRPAEQIPFAGMENRHRTSVDGSCRAPIEISEKPDFLEQFFRKRKRPVEPLDFGDGTRLELDFPGHGSSVGLRGKPDKLCVWRANSRATAPVVAARPGAPRPLTSRVSSAPC